jgi:hypothetical protein
LRDNLVEFLNSRVLLINGELRVSDNVDEENVRDFQLNFFFNLGRHMDSHGNARRDDTLK